MAILKKALGKTKEEIGKLTNNPQMEFDGKKEQIQEETKETLEEIKKRTAAKKTDFGKKTKEKKNELLEEINKKIDDFRK